MGAWRALLVWSEIQQAGDSFEPINHGLKQNKVVHIESRQKTIYIHKVKNLSQTVRAVYLLLRNCSRPKSIHVCLRWSFPTLIVLIVLIVWTTHVCIFYCFRAITHVHMPFPFNCTVYHLGNITWLSYLSISERTCTWSYSTCIYQ